VLAVGRVRPVGKLFAREQRVGPIPRKLREVVRPYERRQPNAPADGIVRGQHFPGKCRLRSSAGESTQNQEQGGHIFIVGEMPGWLLTFRGSRGSARGSTS